MNPFVYGKIVEGDNFFDRKEEASKMVKTLKGGNNMVLYAPRRFGKTSLVFQVIRELEKEGFVCVYFDFMPVYSVESFVRLYSKAISKKQSNISKFAQLFASVVQNIRPVLSFNEKGEQEFSVDFAHASIDESSILRLFDLTEEIATKQKQVFVFFDEFQEVEKLGAINFENLLRSSIQRQQKTNYVFLGSKTHILKEMFNDKTRAFYKSAFQMTLSSLPRKDTVKYLQRNFATQGISMSKRVAEYLIDTASAIPHYVQLLASEVWQINTAKTVTTEIIDTGAQRVVDLNSDYYLELYDRQSRGKKQLLEALTDTGKAIFSAEYIRKNNLTSAASIQRAIKDLVATGVIERVGDEYVYADPFFRRFVRMILKEGRD
jgi:AAA+ ATPase superfamily predicted ATPase